MPADKTATSDFSTFTPDELLAAAERYDAAWTRADLYSPGEWDSAADTIIAYRLLNQALRNGQPLPEAWQQPLHGDDFTDGAGPDATCGCGEAITEHDGEWLHIINPALRGTDDHDAHPDDDYDPEGDD